VTNPPKSSRPPDGELSATNPNFVIPRRLPLTERDQSTVEERGHERQRRVVLASGTAAAAKAVRVLTTFVSLPLAIEYLGAERYGLWLTISSLAAFLTFADLGLGNGLLNAISDAEGRDDTEAVVRAVSSAFFMLLALALPLAVAGAVAYPFVAWGKVFNVTSPQAVEEAGPAAATFFACYLVGMPLGVVERVQLGMQEGFTNGRWEMVGSLFGLAGVLAAIHFRATLPWLVFAMAGGPVLALLLNAWVLFWHQRRWLRPSTDRISGDAARRMLRQGALFFVLQIVGALAFFSDNLVAAHVLGAAAVTQYDVPRRLFDAVALVVVMYVTPLWPAYGEALARGDVQWVRATLVRSTLMLTVFAIGCGVVLVAFGRQILHLWVGPSVSPPLSLLAGFACWTVLWTAGSAAAAFLNGAGRLRFQVLSAVAMGLSAITLKLVLARSVGLPGIVWATIIAYAVCSAIPLAWYVTDLLGSSNELLVERPRH
jgi:O-antigen/teichoic acid export membrane protein